MRLIKRQEANLAPDNFRPMCFKCLRPRIACLCAEIRSFKSDPELVILIHPRETKRAIGTARLAHLAICNSLLFRGDATVVDADSRIQRLIEDDRRKSVVLFPGPGSLDLDDEQSDLAPLRSAPQGLRVFVIDGTWSEARKIVQRSRALRDLPQIMFRPERPSRYRIRKQPKPVCVSTIEAIHALLERCSARGLGRLPASHAHDGLLDVFDRMVDMQIICRDGSPDGFVSSDVTHHDSADSDTARSNTDREFLTTSKMAK